MGTYEDIGDRLWEVMECLRSAINLCGAIKSYGGTESEIADKRKRAEEEITMIIVDARDSLEEAEKCILNS